MRFAKNHVLLTLFLLATLGYVGFAVVSILRELRNRESGGSAALHPAAKFVFAGGIPVGVAATMAYLFLVVGGATTAQFNAGSPSRMNAWSIWVEVWPVFLSITAASGLGALTWLVFCVCGKSVRQTAPASIASLLLSVLAFYTVASYFPSA